MLLLARAAVSMSCCWHLLLLACAAAAKGGGTWLHAVLSDVKLLSKTVSFPEFEEVENFAQLFKLFRGRGVGSFRRSVKKIFRDPFAHRQDFWGYKVVKDEVVTHEVFRCELCEFTANTKEILTGRMLRKHKAKDEI